jgi:hypothetical protein
MRNYKPEAMFGIVSGSGGGSSGKIYALSDTE